MLATTTTTAAPAPWTGFYTGAICRQCGQRLQGQGEGRPAESYAGTYTGLCYACGRGPSVCVATRADGFEQWSHPPHCAAWRRDREIYLWWPGCRQPRCQHGRQWVSRADPMGGSYTVQCESCWSIAHWRQNLADWRQGRRAKLTAAINDCHQAAERWRKAHGLKPGDASEAIMDDPIAVCYRAILRAAWSDERPEYWDLPAVPESPKRGRPC